MSRMSMPFEEKVKSTLENFEYPYEASSWNAIQSRLRQGNVSRTGQASLVALLAASLTTLIGGWVVYNTYFNIPEAKIAGKSVRFEGIHLDYHNVTSAGLTSPSISNPDGSTNGNNHIALLQPSDSNTLTGNPKNGSNISSSSSEISDRHFHTDKTSNLDNVPMVIPPVTPGKNPAVDKAALTFAPSVEEACVGYSVDFGVTNGPKDGRYLWNFGDGSFSTEPTPKHEYSSPGIYDVSLSITKDGVIKSTTMDNMITINPGPDANFEWDFMINGTNNNSVKFLNTSTFANESIWQFSATGGSTEISPVQSFNGNGKHIVELKVINEFGCSDVKTKNICINADDLIKVNQKFAPVKNGKTNVFMPEALAENNFSFRLMVFNGTEKVYETSNNHKGWDGRISDGTIAKEGQSFNWVVVIENLITKEDKLYQGILTIIP